VCAALAATAFVLVLPLARVPVHETFLAWFVGTFVILFFWSLVGVAMAALMVDRVSARRLERVPPDERAALPSTIEALAAASYGELPTSRPGMVAGAIVAAVMSLAFGVALVALGMANATAPIWIIAGVLVTIFIATAFGLLAGAGVVPSPGRPTGASVATFAMGAGIAAAGGMAVILADDNDRIVAVILDGSGAWLPIAVGSAIAAVVWVLATRALLASRR
jgi:hypothetical protein